MNATFRSPRKPEQAIRADIRSKGATLCLLSHQAILWYEMDSREDVSTAPRNDKVTDDGSGLDSNRLTSLGRPLTTNDDNRKRSRQESISSNSEDGHDEAFQTREGYTSRRVKPGTIKACNECRQQKASIPAPLCPPQSLTYCQLRCDVVKDPFQPCSRCKRLKVDCRIDASFKRVGKREYALHPCYLYWFTNAMPASRLKCLEKSQA